jgi:hypothetical protein
MVKHFPPTARLERQGINLCDAVVTGMGHIWREKAVADVGVDGEIELVDGRTCAASGQLLFVQSKARSGNFEAEDADSFVFRCRTDDVAHWLALPVPVLLVVSRPASGEAWFKNLTAWFADPRRRLDRKVHFDKNLDRFDVSARARLDEIVRAARPGVHIGSPPQRESLTSNLLAVDHLATDLYVAPSRVRGWADINARTRAEGLAPVLDVAWRSKQLFSFRPFDEPDLAVLADGPFERMARDEMEDSTAEDDQRLLVRLMMNTLRDIHRKHLLRNDKPDYLYFRATANLADFRIKTRRRGAGRTVFQRYTSRDDPDRTTYYRHYALRSQFFRGDDGWLLALEPTYHYTIDGRTPSRFRSDLLKKIKQLEGHEAVARLVQFWADYLQTGADLFSTPDDRLRFVGLTTVEVDVGIDDRAWKPRPEPEVLDLRAAGDGLQGSIFDEGLL